MHFNMTRTTIDKATQLLLPPPLFPPRILETTYKPPKKKTWKVTRIKKSICYHLNIVESDTNLSHQIDANRQSIDTPNRNVYFQHFQSNL